MRKRVPLALLGALVVLVALLAGCSLIDKLLPPTANINAPSTATIGQEVTLDGSGSTGAESYLWKLTRVPTGSNASISSATSELAYFTPDIGGKYTVSLTVTNSVDKDTATAEITASTSGGGNVAVTAVMISPTSTTVAVGSTQQLSAIISPTNATNQAVTWTSLSTSVATVSSSGVVTGVSAGNATIIVQTADGSKTNYASVQVIAAVAISGVTIYPTGTQLLSAGGTLYAQASVSPVNANQAVTWSSSNSGVATVSSSGVVSAVGGGTATITATASDNAHSAYFDVSVQTGNISVSSVSLTPLNASIYVGGSQQLTATVSPSTATNRAVTWSSS